MKKKPRPRPPTRADNVICLATKRRERAERAEEVRRQRVRWAGSILEDEGARR